MDEARVTILLSEYNQLRDNACINHMLIDKITFYESQMHDIQQRLFELEQKLFKS